MIKKAIFFDRDGVLNKAIIRKKKPYAPKNISRFVIYKNLKKHILKLKQKNYLILVVTNQPDFFLKSKAQIIQMHKKLKKNLPINKIFCSYNVNNKSYKKKPNIGLVEKYIKINKIDLKKSYVVGDRWRDIDFAHNLNCKSIFINRKYKEKLNKKPNYICISTIQAINIILQDEK